MPSSAETIPLLESRLGAERSAAVLRRLVHVPGALSWLAEPPVLEAFVGQIEAGRAPAPAALIAATGAESVEPPAVWPAPLGLRRQSLLAATSDQELDSDDVRLLAAEILASDSAGGAPAVQALMGRLPHDWRAPLACAWDRLTRAGELVARLVTAGDAEPLRSLLAALRAHGSDDETAQSIAQAVGVDTRGVLPSLIAIGEVELAAAIAAIAGTTAGEDGIEPLNSVLHSLWETRRSELAAVADAIAVAAERIGDPLSASEARSRALDLEPTNRRMANAAMGHVQQGHPARALDLLPETPTDPSLQFALGASLLTGGAVEKARPLLAAAATASLESGFPEPDPVLIRHLAACGETGLALDLLAHRLERTPGSAGTRCDLARTLLEAGDPAAALDHATLAAALDPSLDGAKRIRADALAALGRASEAGQVWKSIADPSDPAEWRRSVELAIAGGDSSEAGRLLQDRPEGIPPTDLTLLGARVKDVEGLRAEALAILERAVDVDPGEGSLWLEIARMHEAGGDSNAAGKTLERAAQLAPESPEVGAALARWLRLAGRPSEALEAAGKALTIGSDHPSANFEAGAALLALGRPTEAVRRLRTSHRQRPGALEVRVALAGALQGAGDHAEARALLVHLPDHAPAEAWSLAGRLTWSDPSETVDPKTARAAAGRLLRARALHSEDPSLGFWLGKAYEEAGDPARASDFYREFLAATTPDEPRARLAALRNACCLLASGETGQGIRELESLRQIEGDRAEVLVPLATAYQRGGLAEEARQTALAILRNDVGNRKGLHILKLAVRDGGGWREAAEAFTAAAESDAGPSDLWSEAAEAWNSAGSKEEARRAIARALEAGADPSTKRRLAQVLVDLGEAQQAAQLGLEAATADAADVSGWIELADIAERAKDMKVLVEALDRAAELSPDDASVVGRRAAALWSAGRRSEAIGGWQNALELEPDNARLHGALAGALVSNGEVQAGLNHYAAAVRRHPGDARLLADAGLASLAHGSPREAVETLRAAVAADPGCPEARLGLAEAWLRMRRPDQAMDTLRPALEARKADVRAWSLAAESAMSMGDLAEAKAAILEARRDEPSTLDDRLSLARAEMRLGAWKEALTALTPVLAGGSPRGEAALAEAIVRTVEARWLYATAGFAVRHAPPADTPSETLLAWLKDYLGGADSQDRARRNLAARLRLSDGSADPEAVTALEEAADDPGSIEAVAIAHLASGRNGDALGSLQRLEPDALGASWQAALGGLAHLQAGNPALAMRAFEDAGGDAALRPLALALQARAYQALKDPSGAVEALDEALAAWPEEPVWQEDIARLYLDLGDRDAALPHLQSAAELDPDNDEVRLSLAHVLRDTGHVADALRAYEVLLPRLSKHAQVWAVAGDLALASGDPQRAWTYLQHAAELGPEDPLALVGAARAALATGNLREARRRGEHALKVLGEDARALQTVADVAARQGDIDQALVWLDRAEAVAPDPDAVRRERGRILISAGRPAEAAVSLRSHLEHTPDDPTALGLLGEALEATEDYVEASQAVEAALRAWPRSAALRVQLARLSRKSGQLDRALDQLRHAEDLEPLNPAVALELGQVHESRREFDRALSAYRRAVEVAPDLAEPYRRAGTVLKSLKAYDEAGRMLARAAEIEGDPATLQKLAAVRALQLVHGGTYTVAVTP